MSRSSTPLQGAPAPAAGSLLAAGAGRDPTRRIGRTVLDVAQDSYRFDAFVVADKDGLPRWRVHVGIPNGTCPPSGLPAIWMLDGNAALMEFDSALLAELAGQASSPVLVFIGYDNDLRIDLPARTRDYTFVPDLRHDDAGGQTWLGGGASAFLDVIAHRIRPEITRRVALDPQRQTLWGHSFGGLFTVYALFSRNAIFQTWAAASPSLWWHGGAIVREPEQRFSTEGLQDTARLLLMLGGSERTPTLEGRDMNDPRVREHLARVASVPSDATFQLAKRLHNVPGLDVQYREFEGLGHGPMFRAALMATLHDVAGIADHSGTPSPRGP